ncbi:adenylate/guanylate cyclase domain-containing protein [Jannaschia sp. LMIT008]|uniref:CHASE2 domain-containing protein n=1 Tax=Jannaschia maritima TaxID=3032585 RepID=UPI002811207F|nr:adenylate/guanylate cyclase domain-containing protein [Jannaschia sp. LMIT008]
MTAWHARAPGVTLRQQGRRRAARLARLAALAGGGAAIGLALLLPGTAERLHVLVVDAFQRAAPRVAAGAPVTVVDIDEGSLTRFGQWPWPRATIARMTDALTDAGAAAIAFDVVFAEPDRLSPEAAADLLRAAGADVTLPDALPGGDAALAQAFARGPVVAGLILTPDGARTAPGPKAGFATIGPDARDALPDIPAAVPNLPILREAAAGLGAFSLIPEADGVVRRVPLVYRSGDALLPGLAVEALRVAQGAGAVTLRTADPGPPALEAVRVGAFTAPTGARGRFWVHHSGLPDMARVPAATILDRPPGDWSGAVAGHIVLIGTSAAGLRDLVVTPLARGVPGVEVHAEIIDQILSGATLARPDWARGAEVVLAALLVLGAGTALRYVGVLGGAAWTVGGIAIAVGTAWWAFGRGVVLDPLFPSVAVSAALTAGTVVLLLLTERERRGVRRAFGLYLAPALVERLAEDPAALRLDGTAREITILFCDLRGFSALSEGMDPTELTATLNGFLTPMTEVLLDHGATIDKYMGDAIMAFWNAPLPVPDHPRRAMQATLAMGEALRARNRDADGPPLSIGIGLNTGTCCVGNLGSTQRFAYSAIGDAVNVASRVEGLTRFYGVGNLATAETVAAGGMATLELDLVRVKGRTGPVGVHTVLGDAAMATTPDFDVLRTSQAAWLDAWRAGDADAARAALAALDGTGLPPGVLSLQRERTAWLAGNPPGAGWDGIYVADSKAPSASSST